MTGEALYRTPSSVVSSVGLTTPPPRPIPPVARSTWLTTWPPTAPRRGGELRRTCEGREANHPQDVESQRQRRIDSDRSNPTGRARDEAPDEYDGEQDAEPGEVDVDCGDLGQDRSAGEEPGPQEEDRQECIAAEDVTHRQLVVAHAHRCEPGGDLRQRSACRKQGRPEDNARDPKPIGDLLAALFEEQTCNQGYRRGDCEASEDTRSSSRDSAPRPHLRR